MRGITLFLGCIFFIINSHVLSQDKNVLVRYIEAKSDKNIVPESGPDFSASKTDKCYIIDGDESKGYMEIEFEGINASKTPQTITLVANCADVEYAETATGVSVYLGSQKLGSISQIYRNSKLEVLLDVNLLKSANSCILTIKSNDIDGLYLLSKKSGFGPFLVITY